MRTVTVDISELTSAFQSTTDDIAEKIRDAAEKAIAEVVQNEIQKVYNELHPSDYIGDNDINVDANAIPDGWELVASGSTLGFIEFGTGEQADQGKPEYMQNADYPIAPGSWSSSMQGTGEFVKSKASPKYWHYKKQRVEGGPGVHAIEGAINRIADALPDKVKEHLQ